MWIPNNVISAMHTWTFTFIKFCFYVVIVSPTSVQTTLHFDLNTLTWCKCTHHLYKQCMIFLVIYIHNYKVSTFETYCGHRVTLESCLHSQILLDRWHRFHMTLYPSRISSEAAFVDSSERGLAVEILKPILETMNNRCPVYRSLINTYEALTTKKMQKQHTVDVMVMATVTPNTVHSNAKSTYTASTITSAAYSTSSVGVE